MNKQIEEMAELCCYPCEYFGCPTCNPSKCDIALDTAKSLYNAGYRKVEQGEWVDTGDKELDTIYSGWKCSKCGYIFCGYKTNYCSNCGAKMKGAE